MKKILIGLAIAAVAFGAAVAGEDTTGLKYLPIVNASFTNQADNGVMTVGTLTNGFDIGAYKGRGKLVLVASGDVSETTPTTNNSAIYLQHANTATGLWSNVTGGSVALSTTGITSTVSLDLAALHRYVRIGVKVLGTNTLARQFVGAALVLPRAND